MDLSSFFMTTSYIVILYSNFLIEEADAIQGIN